MNFKGKERHNEDGTEKAMGPSLNPNVKQHKEPSLHEMVTQQIRSAKIREWEAEFGEETDEEADDFEVGDDFEPTSPHENDHIPTLAQLREDARQLNERIKQEQRKMAVEDHYKRYPHLRPGASDGTVGAPVEPLGSPAGPPASDADK